MPRFLLPPDHSDDDEYGLLRVQGDGLADKHIADGSTLLVRFVGGAYVEERVDNGAMVIARTPDGPALRRYHRTNQHRVFSHVSNKTAPPLLATNRSKAVGVVARVIAVMQSV